MMFSFWQLPAAEPWRPRSPISTSPGDKVVVLTAGKFGERWRDLAKAFHCQVELVSVPYGQTFNLQDVKAKLGGARVVYMQATETSTGARHDVKAIGSLLKGTDTLFVVDAITGLGTTKFDVDGWGIDDRDWRDLQKVRSRSRRAQYLSVSERAWQQMEQAQQPRFYFDLRKERKAAAKGESAFTPATALIAGLLAALDYIRKSGGGDLAAGRDALIHNAETSAEMVRAGAKALGLKLFAPSCPASAVTALVPPDGVDSSAMVKEFRERFAMVVANGQGEMKGKMIRIAHIGYYDYLDAIGVIGALEQVLLKTAPSHRFELGTGVRAVQEVYAEQFAEVATA